MNCTCPKCQANVELENLPAEITEQGSNVSCPACNAKFVLYRESFAARALRKTAEISCASCGNALGPHLHCHSCGIPFPSYIVAALSQKRPVRKTQSVQISFNLFPKPTKSAINIPSLAAAAKEHTAAGKKTAKGKVNFSDKRALAATIVALVALVVCGTGFYLKDKAEKRYMRNFAVGCYAIQVGVDKSRKTCQSVAIDWKSRRDAGQSFVYRPSIDDDREFARLKTKLDSVKAKLTDEPKKFAECNQKLNQLEAAYLKLHTVAATPGNSLQEFNDAYNQADTQYKQAARELKNGIPSDLMDEIRASSQKFLGLRPFLKEG